MPTCTYSSIKLHSFASWLSAGLIQWSWGRLQQSTNHPSTWHPTPADNPTWHTGTAADNTQREMLSSALSMVVTLPKTLVKKHFSTCNERGCLVCLGFVSACWQVVCNVISLFLALFQVRKSRGRNGDCCAGRGGGCFISKFLLHCLIFQKLSDTKKSIVYPIPIHCTLTKPNQTITWVNLYY